jgi:hypothetical protein
VKLAIAVQRASDASKDFILVLVLVSLASLLWWDAVIAIRALFVLLACLDIIYQEILAHFAV